MDVWAELDRPPASSVVVGGIEVTKGSRVRLRPRAWADIFDLALGGRVGVVEGIDQDLEGGTTLAVTLEDDPGRALGEDRQPGHRFFFALDEIEPLGAPSARRILVAGIGNVFLGDDGFGVEVARRLGERTLPDGVTVRDFGIRGLDLAYALQEDWTAVILVDAAPRGAAPGTLHVIEPDLATAEAGLPDAHGMDPVHVLRLAKTLGRLPARVLLVGCEPLVAVDAAHAEDVLVELSAPVEAAAGEAVRVVESLVTELREGVP